MLIQSHIEFSAKGEIKRSKAIPHLYSKTQIFFTMRKRKTESRILFTLLLSLFIFPSIDGKMTGQDTIFSYPYYGDECISGCGSDGTCNTMKGFNYPCSSEIGFTYNNKKCGGQCIPGHSHYYCYTPGSWDYCSLHQRRPRVAHFASNGARCVSSCHNFGGTAYTWCSVSETMNYQYCSKTPGVTYQGEHCTGPCHQHSNYWKCSTASTWDYCGRVENEEVAPVVIKVWRRGGGEFSAELVGSDSSSVPSPDKVSVQLGDNDSCDRNQRRIRRGVTETCPWAPRTTEQTLDELFQDFERQAAAGGNMRIETHWDPDGPNSVDTVYRRVFNPAQNLTRTEGISALITARHVRDAGSRVDFTDAAKRYMLRNLNAIQTVDVAGHLVASAMGGPPETYNLVPQHRSVNGNIGGTNRTGAAARSNDWVSMERRMGQFFGYGQPGGQLGGQIRFRVAIYYLNSNTGRPYMFQYLATFLDENGQEMRNANWYPIPGVWQNRQG